jgi:L-asparaginase
MLILVTGGTFDKQYDPIRGELGFAESHLPEILRQSRITIPVRVQLLELMDSLQMTHEDRLNILAACREAEERRIIVIHGTDTMVESAEVVGEAGLRQTIVFTGAMIPYSVVGSDALFNLGSALMAVQLLPTGVHVVMNGRAFEWDNVRKDRAEGAFVNVRAYE